MSAKNYEVFRKASRDVIHKIMHECLKPDQLMKSARLLGIVREDIMVFNNEDETGILMDFALHEYALANRQFPATNFRLAQHFE